VDRLPTLAHLDELANLVQGGAGLYVRWSKGPVADASGRSRDELTGVELPGLSASPLQPEEWWGDRSVRTWVARRLYDYSHLPGVRGPGVRPWIFEGVEVSRGPDNEPIVRCDQPVAFLSDHLVEEARQEVDAQPAEWGSLSRTDRQ
jgi:hypothetical protein